MIVLRKILVIVISGFLAQNCVTSSLYKSGRKYYFDEKHRVYLAGDRLLLEFDRHLRRTRHSHSNRKTVTFVYSARLNEIFSTGNFSKKLVLHKGRAASLFPAAESFGKNKCLAIKQYPYGPDSHERTRFILQDTCRKRESVFDQPAVTEKRKWWAWPWMVLMTPVAVAADIITSPVQIAGVVFVWIGKKNTRP